MGCYMYQAALWCEPCGEAIRAKLDAEGKAPADPSDDYSYDSDDYPKDCSGLNDESDSVEVCECGEFLGNSLTSHGAKELRESALEFIVSGRGSSDYWRGVLENYDWELSDVTLADLVRDRLKGAT